MEHFKSSFFWKKVMLAENCSIWNKFIYLKKNHALENCWQMLVNLKSSRVQKLIGHLKVDCIFDKNSCWKVSVCLEKVHGCLQIWKKFTHFKIIHAFKKNCTFKKGSLMLAGFLKNSCIWKLLRHLKNLNGCPPIWKKFTYLVKIYAFEKS